MALCGPALAGPWMEPPARYAKGPYIARVEIRDWPPEFVRLYCGEAPGCALVGKAKCIIILVNGIPDRGGALRHERAHCRGWPQDHPR